MRYCTTISLGMLLALLIGSARAQTAPPAADTTRPKHYTYTETLPVFPALEPGDSARSTSQRFMKFLNEGLIYPPRALRDGVSGRVYLAFSVDSQGHTADLKLVKGLRADVDAEVLRNAHRLDAIQWQPGTQNGRPVTVAFTAPISLNIEHNSRPHQLPGGDSLDLGPYQKLALPLLNWNSDRKQIPAGKGLIYGSCLQRLGGSSSLGTGEYVRLVNLNTQKSIRINVKPLMNSRRENAFCYALPAGRYALFLYEYPDPVWGGYKMYTENIRKTSPVAGGADLHATRYQFIVEPGKLHYVGTWNLANENEPTFLNEKTILDGRLQANHESLNLSEAQLAVPK